MNRGIFWATAVILCAAGTARPEEPDVVRVGAKAFTEQHILGEIVAQLIEQNTDLRVEREFDLGGTGLCHSALVSGAIDVYVEYTGTALVDILKERPRTDSEEVFRIVSKAYRDRFDAVWLPPIGFNNTYALTVREVEAAKKGWAQITDLKKTAPSMRAGFTSEFVERPDGYPGLAAAYGFRFGQVMDMDPGLMYAALEKGEVDIICAFATDGRIAAYQLRTLEDDRSFFPPYDAAPVVRGAILREHPEIADALVALIKTIDDESMRKLNYAVDGQRERPKDVAAGWIEDHAAGGGPLLARRPTSSSGFRDSGFVSFLLSRRRELLRKTLEHLELTGIALAMAIAAGVPTGVLIHRIRGIATAVLAFTEIVQTVPSLAMLAFLFAVYGVLGAAPAATALVLYALLPIVLNTFTGLRNVPGDTIEAADGIGMASFQRLRIVELPLAMPVIIAGIRTAAVWTVGIATLSTYIGAGGLGDFISRGLARNDSRLTLLGAVPAAIIAMVLSIVIRLVERRARRW